MHHTQTFGFATLALGDVAFNTATKLMSEMISLPPFQQGSTTESGYAIVSALALFTLSGVCIKLINSVAYSAKYEDEATKLQGVGLDCVEKCLKPQSVERNQSNCTIRFRTQLVPIGRVADLLWNQSD